MQLEIYQWLLCGEPKNKILFILVGVFFALFGLATIIWNIRTIVKETKAEIQGTTAGAEENEDGEEAAKKVSLGKGVADVHVGADTKEEKSADKEERKETAAEEKGSGFSVLRQLCPSQVICRYIPDMRRLQP